MRINSVGIVGYGNFGAFVHELLKRFAPTVQVKVHSKDKDSDGKLFFPLKDAAKCDAVVLAVPISSYEEVISRIAPLMHSASVIVDVATVKMHTTALLKKLAGKRPFIATHPMFGPESYAKRAGDVSNLRIVVTEHTLPQKVYKESIEFIRKCGFNVIEMTANKHDKHLAETLFLTHFVGQVITKAKFDRTEIDTVSFGFLMDAVESVRADKKLFEDVFRYNPHCKRVLEKFGASVLDIRKQLRS